MKFAPSKKILNGIKSELMIGNEATIEQVLKAHLTEEVSFLIIAKTKYIKFSDQEVKDLLNLKHEEFIRFDIENYAFETFYIDRFSYNHTTAFFKGFFTIEDQNGEIIDKEVDLWIPLLSIKDIFSLKDNKISFSNVLIKHIEELKLKKLEKGGDFENLRRYDNFVKANTNIFPLE